MWWSTYPLDVILEHTSDGLTVLDVLLRDDCKVTNLISIVAHKIFQRVFVIISDLFRRQACRHVGGAAVFAGISE